MNWWKKWREGRKEKAAYMEKAVELDRVRGFCLVMWSKADTDETKKAWDTAYVAAVHEQMKHMKLGRDRGWR